MSPEMNKKKTKNVLLNASVGLFIQLITILITFVSRTIFIDYLGNEYLGLNNLFVNILTMLSMAELGFGTAISYNLYKSINAQDYKKINSLIKFFRKIYFRIGLFVFAAGLLVLPFLPSLVGRDMTINVNIHVVFLMFLLNSSVSYLFSYNLSLMDASQNRRITDFIYGGFTILKETAAFVILLTTNNYYLYLGNLIINTIIMYIFAQAIVKRKFKFLDIGSAEELESSEKKAIFINVSTLMIYKIAGVVLVSSDSILISSIVGIAEVAILANYQLFINAFNSLVWKVIVALTGSVGLANDSNNSENVERLFLQTSIFLQWFIGFIAIGFYFLINDVIFLWLDSYSFLFSRDIVLILSITFLIEGISKGPYLFRTTMGLFNKGNFMPVIAIIMKIFLGILFGILFGVLGIFASTVIVRLFTFFLVDPHIIYKNRFQKSSKSYYFKIMIFFITSCLAFLLIGFIFKFINGGSMGVVILKILIVTVVVNVFYLIQNAFDKDFRFALKQIKNTLASKNNLRKK